MSKTYPCSVVLAAHGSLAHDESNNSLFELSKQVAQSGIFSLVTPAFLNGQPQITGVLAELPPGDVIVIPVMTSEGFYAQNILPGKLSENVDIDSYRIFLTPALGVHPEIASHVADRIATLTTLLQLKSSETTVVIIGHGTPRHPNSSQSTIQLAQRVQEHLPELNTVVGFIDQEPTIQQVIAQMETPHTLVVPFLISRGPHATVDVPEAFGLPTGQDVEFPLVEEQDGKIIICDLPVGLYPEMAELCVELAADAMLNGQPMAFSEFNKQKPA